MGNTPNAPCLTNQDWQKKPRPAVEIDLKLAEPLLKAPYNEDKQSAAVWGEYTDKLQKRHQIWFDVPETLSRKYMLARQLNLKGVGMWTADAANYSTDQGAQMWRALEFFTANGESIRV